MIKQISLNHKGGFYFYSIHSGKLDKMGKFSKLRDFLYNTFNDCPDQYFNSGPRSSTLKFDPELDVKRVMGHEMSSLAKEGLKDKVYDSNHLKVQMFLLQHDPKTIAIEVPIWIKWQEFDGFKDLFQTSKPLTGHIDLLRFEDDKVWVWDYKPNADKEKYACAQLLFYAFMLSKRTGINIDQFRCGYFDDQNAFLFRPKMSKFEKNCKLTRFV